jgi:hypothetical protein
VPGALQHRDPEDGEGARCHRHDDERAEGDAEPAVAMPDDGASWERRAGGLGQRLEGGVEAGPDQGLVGKLAVHGASSMGVIRGRSWASPRRIRDSAACSEQPDTLATSPTGRSR